MSVTIRIPNWTSTVTVFCGKWTSNDPELVALVELMTYGMAKRDTGHTTSNTARKLVSGATCLTPSSAPTSRRPSQSVQRPQTQPYKISQLVPLQILRTSQPPQTCPHPPTAQTPPNSTDAYTPPPAIPVALSAARYPCDPPPWICP